MCFGKVEMNPFWQQKLREFCESNGIHVISYSPLGAKGTILGSIQVLECEVLNDTAKAREKTMGQVGPINQIYLFVQFRFYIGKKFKI